MAFLNGKKVILGYLNGQPIKPLGKGSISVLKTSYMLQDVSKVLNFAITIPSASSTATSYSISSFKASVDGENKAITISEVKVVATFSGITTSETRSIQIVVTSKDSSIVVNGNEDEPLIVTQSAYMVGTQSGVSSAELTITDIELTFNSTDVFNEVVAEEKVLR